MGVEVPQRRYLKVKGKKLPKETCTSWLWSCSFWLRPCPCCPFSILLHVGFVPITRFYNMPISDHSRLLLQLFIVLGHQLVFSWQHKGPSPTRNIFHQTVLTRKALHQRLLRERTFTPEALDTTNSLHQRSEGEAFAPETSYTEQVCTYTRRLLHHKPVTLQTTNSLHHNPFTPEAL